MDGDENEVLEPPSDATVESLWKEVKNLRKESAGRRVKANQYDAMFDGYSEDEIGVLQQRIQGFNTYDDPSQGAVEFVELGRSLMGDSFENYLREQGFTEKEITEVTNQAGEESQPAQQSNLSADAIAELVRKEIASAFNDHRQEEDNRTYRQTVEQQATALGYEPGTLQWKFLMSTAGDFATSGDPDPIATAHQTLQDMNMTPSLPSQATQPAQEENEPRFPATGGQSSSNGAQEEPGEGPSSLEDATQMFLAKYRASV